MKLWRTLIVLAVAIVASIVVIAVSMLNTPANASEQTFDVGRADVRISVLPDARLRIEENLRYRFSDHPFSGAYRDIALHPGTTLSRFTVNDGSRDYEPGASTALGSAGALGSYGTEELPDGAQRVVWHYQHSGGGHEDFQLGYLATGASEAYDDVVLVRWAIWGDQWKFPLDRLLGSISLAEPADGSGRPIQAWLTPARLQIDPQKTATGARAAVDRAPQGHQVELAVLYPRSAFASVSGATVHDGNGRALLTAREDAAAESATGALSNWLWRASGPLAGLAALLALLATVVLLRRGRELRSTAPKYLPEPPEDLSPATAYGLATEGDYDNRVVLATLLDLVDRGFYRQSAGAAEGKKAKDGQLDLILAVGDRGPGAGAQSLPPHERTVLDFFDRLIGGEPGALASLSDRIPKHSSEWRTRWTTMNAELKLAGRKELEWSRDLGLWRTVLLVVLVGAMALVGVLAYPRADQWYAPALGAIWAAAFLLLPTVNALRRLTPDVRGRQARWESFARWTKDFPRLSDDPPATLLLWKRILVYGVAFGTAQRVVESGRIPEGVMREASGTWWGGTHSGVGNPSLYAFMGASNFASDFSSGFSSQVAAQSSSGGGGGGGGGGGSGGGGGGAW